MVVTLTNIESKEDEVYKIVGTTEASILDPETPSISNESPVGQAIL